MAPSREAIIAVILSALELPEGTAIAIDAEPAAVPGWDSAGWIKVITALETDLGIETPFEELDRVQSVEDFLELITR